MAQEMSFAQALTEARQIIVQQSNRIKSDLEKIKSLQDTVASQSATISENERTARERADQIDQQEEQITSLNTRLGEVTTSLEQAEAINDRQGQRLTQMQETVADLERQLTEQTARANQLSQEIEGLRNQLPTSEDEEALAALSHLLTTKKVSVPAVAGGNNQPMRIAPERAEAA